MSLPRGPRLGLDVGSVRVGLASSDPDGLLATPVDTIAPGDRARVVREVCERGAAVVYVGLPRHLSGSEGASAAVARDYAVSLAGEIDPVEVRMVDERMSTVSATAALRASGRPGRRQRSVVDQAAAVVILQGALDAERATGSRVGERVAAHPDAETKTER
ncbi:MAG: Holliday junction resolvase RuvX [Actinomycetales bacterium]|nr:Holliday junction resolvase RuvX [Actinomycetales bacterium]